jgi:aryl-alcohol dehydrogenase-like predicted oxidoreductase
MLYRFFGKTNWSIAVIGMGTWNIGNQWGKVDAKMAENTIQAAIEYGVNLFDTADTYGIPFGLSEERLGESLVGRRHQVYIVTKIGKWGRRTGSEPRKMDANIIRLWSNASLKRLRTDYLDVILCHEANIDNPNVFLEGFEGLKKEGKIRAYGISTNSIEALKRFNTHGTCSVVQVDYSLLNRAPEDSFLPYCQEHDIAVMVRGPLGKGLLSGKYNIDSVFSDSVRTNWNKEGSLRSEFKQNLNQVEKLKSKYHHSKDMIMAALRFTISHPAVSVVIPGSKSPEQAQMNAATGEALLSKEEITHLRSLLEVR